MKPKVLVVGDAMWDKYYIGTTSRISPEAPIPVVKVGEMKAFGGGAYNVANNLKDLGAEVRIVYGHVPGTSIHIPEKNRLMVGTQQLARWDEYDEVGPIDLTWLEQAVLEWEPEAIVVSDYGKGSVTYNVLQWCLSRSLPLFLDTKGTPAVLPNATLFPNQHEYEAFRQEYDVCPNVVLKRSSAGIQRLVYGEVKEEYPAWAKSAVSVTGAGDTVLAAYAYACCVGLHPLPFANAAAAVAVSKPWTASATVEEIMALAEEVAKCQDTKAV